MVATDVASRGIGMIKTLPSPHPHAMTSSQQPCSTLDAPALFSLRNLTRAFISSHGSLSKGILDLLCSIFFCYTDEFAYCVSRGYMGETGIS